MNSINKYFTRLTPNKIKGTESQVDQQQASQIAHDAQETRETLVQEVTTTTISEVIKLNNNHNEISVINSLADDTVQRDFNSEELLLPTVASITVDTTECLKRYKNNRPSNWTDIANHFITYGKYRSTIKQFNLTTINPSYEHWRKILSRWKKDLINNKKITGRRAPVYGSAIDDELANIVKDYYMKHSVMIGDSILRSNLIRLLEKEERLDILNRILPDDQEIIHHNQLRFGPEWARRFYKRHNLSSNTVATSKMRVDEAVEDSSSDGTENEEDEVEETEQAMVHVQHNVRQRKSSTLDGSIKKRKYSR